ncbi:MAG: hypothetical protein QOI94_2292 [Acidobacteriaceae bacterium]|jgi:predicted short-subunit dehydrogenase-like oxidoreductase (DUF2520 family)|nr:hypothetical protein [Acidobacteriaceae bacterium]
MGRSVSIIGLGNWGSSLAHALDTAGVNLQEVIISSERSRVGRPAWTRTLPLTTLDRAQLKADVLWLCVPDAAIKRVTGRMVKRVGKRGFEGHIVVHSSGALSALELQAAARVGATVASVHPVMSFATRVPVSLQGVPFGVEAEASSRRILNAIVRQAGGRPFAVEAASKALYHAVGVLSSPLLVSHLAAAHEAAGLAGFTPQQAKRLIAPIVRATLDNFFLRGPGKSFSGPIARGDVQTIHLHLQALKPHPMLAGVYRSLALYALETLPAAGKKKLRSSLRRSSSLRRK